MKAARTYNPCDECDYSYSRTSEESSTCKICELTYYVNIRPKSGKWIPASNKPGVQAGMKCSLCKARITYSEYHNGQHLYCHKCGAKMEE